MPTPEQALENVRVGATIRAHRRTRGVTTYELAERIGCSPPHISNIETGRSRATEATLKAIADALGLEVGDLAVAS